MELRLLVIRTADPERLVRCYTLFGQVFEHHRHGSGPLHYSATLGAAVLEIYPLLKHQTAADTGLRLGFGVQNLEAVVVALKAAGIAIAAEPAETEFGTMAVIIDPDGRKIELYESRSAADISPGCTRGY